jgi:hypothetical protein
MLLPRLETRQIAEAQARAAWRAKADELEPRGAALLHEFAQFYPQMAKRIAKHLDDIRASISRWTISTAACPMACPL